jgi:hypothetical protein
MIILLFKKSLKIPYHKAVLLTKQSVGRHVAPLGHIIPILSQPVFVLTP